MDNNKPASMRSPGFPNISLKRAIEKVDIFFSIHKRLLVPVVSALLSMGYSKSSKGLQILAALKYYGLVDIEGKFDKQRVKISDLAFRIIMDKRPVSAERDAALKTAALSPKLFNALVEKYRESFPSDDVLTHDLTFEYKFNPNSVQDFLEVFKETIEVAKIYDSGIIEEENTGLDEPLSSEDSEKDSDKMMSSSAISPKQTGTPIITKPGIAGNVLSFNEFIPGFTFQLIAKNNIEITQKTINRLIKFLELTKEDYPTESTIKDSDSESPGCHSGIK